MNRGWRSLRNEIVVGLAAVIVVSGAAAWAISGLWAGWAFTALVEANDRVEAEQLADELGAWYEDCGSWAEVDQVLAEHRRRERGGPQDAEAERSTMPVVVLDPAGLVVYNGFREDSDDRRPFPSRLPVAGAVPVLASTETVGFVFFKTMLYQVYNPREAEYLRSTTWALGTAFLVQLVLALGLGAALATRSVRPVVQMEAAVRRLAAGESHEPIPIVGRNEAARLSAHFNALVEQLEAEEARRTHFLADVAHELRTPVSILQANLEMMIEGVYPPDRARLSSLYEETQLLTKLIDDLRTLADLEGASPSPGPGDRPDRVDLGALVDEAVASVGPLWPQPGPTLVWERPPTVFSVAADPQRLRQVVRIFLDNARRYAADGPRVEVRLEATRHGDGDGVRLTVADQGPGVAEAEVGRLFERFYRADRSRNRHTGGRGLGLAIARRIVTAAGGQVGAEPQRPRGLAVWFNLPLARSEPRPER